MKDFQTTKIGETLASLIASGKHITPITDGDYSANKYRAEITDIAKECPQTALAFGMHLYQLWAMSIKHADIIARYRSHFIDDGKLMCSLNDPGTYFIPPEDLSFDRFPIKAKRVSGGYEVSGRKPFSSMSNFISFTPVTAIERSESGENKLVSLLINNEINDVQINADWNSISMPDTATNSISINKAFVPEEDVLHSETGGAWADRKSVFDLDLFLYRFHICVTYEAIGGAALALILDEFSSEKSPLHNLRTYPHPQYQLASMIMQSTQNEAVMDSLSTNIDKYISGDQEYSVLDNKTLITKELVTSTSEKIVNEALAVIGIRSLSQSHPLSALYTNVKAGRFHPPQPASAYELIAKNALNIDPQDKMRWKS